LLVHQATDHPTKDAAGLNENVKQQCQPGKRRTFSVTPVPSGHRPRNEGNGGVYRRRNKTSMLFLPSDHVWIDIWADLISVDLIWADLISVDPG
jgi:hypothetical protein